MTAYYNEHDPFAAAWLRELIKAGHIAPGEVDERSIEDVRPDELRGFTQCHFFAGIGVWSYALRCAGWPDDRPVWTGSCPCQPFSTAGKRKGTADERHLWPSLFHLIKECKPANFFGEQVASKDGLAWLDVVLSDLEGSGYPVGSVDLCAAGFGAPHIRQRLYFVADSTDVRRKQRGSTPSTSVQGDGTVREGQHPQPRHEGQLSGRPEGLCGVGCVGLADSTHAQRHWSGNARTTGRGESSDGCILDNSTDSRRQETREYDGGPSLQSARSKQPSRTGDGLGESTSVGQSRREQCDRSPIESRGEEPSIRSLDWEQVAKRLLTGGFWTRADWVECHDGRQRPVEPGTFPLAHGATNRVGRLRGYGNALVAPVAQGFIESYLEVERERGDNK